MYHGLQYVGLLRVLYRALYTSCYCHIMYACVYFMSVKATFAVAARTRKVSQRPCTCPTTGNILILHKALRVCHDGNERDRHIIKNSTMNSLNKKHYGHGHVDLCYLAIS